MIFDKSTVVFFFMMTISVFGEVRHEEYEKYPQCDGLGRDGIVHAERKNGKLDNFPEKMCVKKMELAEIEKENAEGRKRNAEGRKRIAEGRKRIAKLDKENAKLSKESAKLSKESAKLIKLLALLSPKALKEQFIRMQDNITKEKDAHKKERLQKELDVLKKASLEVKTSRGK